MFEPHLYAVFGSPVAHSRSPQIHRMFAEQTGQDLIYTKQEVLPGEFNQTCAEFFELGGCGLNLTLPLKELAFQLASTLTPRAKLAAAVNTLRLEDDASIIGDNTDGCGMVRDMLDNQRWSLRGRRILVLGAGGAVRGVLGPLLEQAPHSVWVANRTAAKAKLLATEFAHLGNISACGLDALPAELFDIIINGTSMSLHGEAPPLTQGQITAQTACYDMAYGSEPTAFLKWGREQGLSALADGLGMLVEQAAESFQFWRGVMPKTSPVIAALRGQ